MLTPYGRLLELDVSPKANYRCLELSPDGTLVVAVTVNSVEIWSYRSNITLLASLKQSRPTGYSKALLNRLFVLWNNESNKFVVIRSEGIVDYYNVELKQKIQEDVYEEQYSPSSFLSVSIKKVYSISIEQHGYPISSCTIYDKIIIATDSNQIAELNWNGDSVGCPLSRFIPNSSESTELQNRSIVSVTSCPYLSCLAIALDDDSCLMLQMVPTSGRPIHSTTVSLRINDGVRQILFCPGSTLLAVTSTRLSIDFYQVDQDLSEACCHYTTVHLHSIDIRQYPQVHSSPLFAYDSIISMCWSPGKAYLAIGLKYQGLMVWSVEGEMVFSYNQTSNVHSPPSSLSESLTNTMEVSCCCFSLDASRLLFNIPYAEVRQDNQDNLITTTSCMFCQQFVITPNTIQSVENCSFFGYTASSLVHVVSIAGSSLAMLPSVIPLPADFISRDEVILGMQSSPSGRNVLLFTSSSLCIFSSSRGKWYTAINFVKDGFITACCWLTDYIFILSVSPTSLSKPGAVLYAVNMNYLDLSKVLQEIDVNFSSLSEYKPSLQHLLPTAIPSSSFPFIQSLHCQENLLLCSTSTGLFYLFSIDDSLESLTASTKHLPMSFVSKGDIHSSYPLKHSFILSTPRTILLEDETTMEVMCNDILAVYWDQRVTLIHLTEDAEDDQLFARVKQIVLCEHQDRGVIHNPMNIDNFILFIQDNQQIAWFPTYERTPSSCTSAKNTLIPSQTVGGFWGFSWRKCALISTQHCGDEVNSMGEKNWLQPIAVCCYHLLIAELLHANQLVIASAYLQLGVSLKLPGFVSSMEYLLHNAINNDDSSFLAICLQLLSQLPYYSRILVRCLRKQERSMWPFAVQKTEDIIHLFHTFLFTNDMEYSITTISILHGLLCNVSQTSESVGPTIPISTWKQNIQSNEDWLLDDYSEVFTGAIPQECPAHLNGLQLLLVCIMKKHFGLMTDVYRYLLMEETRHQECNKKIPSDYVVNEVLSWVCYVLFKRGHLDTLYGLVKNLEFTWTIQPTTMQIDNFATCLQELMKGCRWEMKIQLEGEDETLVSEPLEDSLISEEEMTDLLRCLMLAGFAEWSLVLLLLLLKSKQLINFALARDDIWTRCIQDFSVSSDTNMQEFLGFLQHEVDERRKEFCCVC